jgi:hypothetical protein
MPARFWGKPENAPAHLNLFPQNSAWFSHHLHSFSEASRIPREGLLSQKEAKRLGMSIGMTNWWTAHPDNDNILLYELRHPLERLESQDKFGKIRVLMWGDTPTTRDESGSLVSKTRIPADSVCAFIVPDKEKLNPDSNELSFFYTAPKSKEKGELAPQEKEELRSFLNAAKEQGIPVYSRDGERLWPKIKK